MSKKLNKILSIVLNLLIICCFIMYPAKSASADDFSMEKVTYSEDYEAQESIDEELFGEESEYEEYDVYTEVADYDEQEDDTTQMIILAPDEFSKNSPGMTLHATVEKSYSFRSVEAFNTIWDNSQNFRTLYRTLPSMMQTAPSIIHAAHYRFRPDENTSVYWGHASLSSFNGTSVGFVGKLESDYDTGLKIETKLGKMHVGAAIYDSLETNNPSGGIVVSSEELKIGRMNGSFILGGGVYTNEAGNDADSTNAAGIFTKYKKGRFSLGAQFAKTQYASSKGEYGSSFYLYPEYKLTNSLSIKSKIANHIDQNYNQEEIGLTYKPAKNNPNDFSISLNATLYNGEGTTNKQRFKLSTQFKL